MDFGTLVFFGFLWFLFNLLRRGGTTAAPPREPPVSMPSETPSASTGRDPTQREGNRLEALLRDLNRSLETAAHAKTSEIEAEVEEERESLEETPVVVNLETDVPRPARRKVDQDDLAPEIIARRIAAAEARNRALAPVDHREFDYRIRQEPADHTAVRTYSPEDLRKAVVWREILGPPVTVRTNRDND